MNTGAVFAIVLTMSALAVTLVVLYLRHRTQQMLHQERLAALDKGTVIPLGRDPGPWSPRVYLLRGLIWSFTGVALAICLYGVSLATERPMSATSAAYQAGSLSRNLDIPLTQAQTLVEKDQAAEMHGMPASVSLLGLIPFGVGLAYLVFYYTDPSRKLSVRPS